MRTLHGVPGLVGTLALLAVAGCSDPAAPQPSAHVERQANDVLALPSLRYIDPSSPDAPQHPLVCGAGRDFPDGRELVFRDPGSGRFIHAVFPAGVVVPGTHDGGFALHGQYQGIRNWDCYTLKKPDKDYRYFVVSSWEHEE